LPEDMTVEAAKKIFEYAEKYKELWSKWEGGFMASIKKRLARSKALTPKQAAVLISISGQFTKEDVELKRKLIFIIKSKVEVFRPVQKILADMYRRKLGHFSLKQKTLINKNYYLVQKRLEKAEGKKSVG